MYKISSNFSVSCFRSRMLAWIMLTVFCFSFMPSVSLAQQPIATIKTLSGTVLVNGQEQKEGVVLSTGDVIETQTGASAVLELSDGSEIHLGEKTQINIADLAQTTTGARVSYIKLLSGRLRAFLSQEHQQKDSSFTVETPNAQVGVKFSEPDVEVSYDPEKAETVGIAHTVELIATNLLTGETKLVPVGSSVIIVGMMMKVIAGTTAAAIAAGTETAAAETATGIGTGTKVAIGAGAAAAAGGVAVVAASSGEGGDGENETAESIGDLSGVWKFSGSCVAQGCIEEMGCSRGPVGVWCGQEICDACTPSPATIPVTQSGNVLSGWADYPGGLTLTGVVNSNSVTFTTEGGGPPIPIGNNYNSWEGTLDGNIIRGTFSGSCPNWSEPGNETATPTTVTWSGTFTVTIRKE